MALAILDLTEDDGERLRFTADTGSNPYYRLTIGRKVRQHDGFDLVDDVLATTPLATNPAAGAELSTRTTFTVPATAVPSGGALVQLCTFRTRDGTGPAYSRPLRVVGRLPGTGLPWGQAMSRGATVNSVRGTSSASSASSAQTFRPARSVPCRVSGVSRQASLADLLGEIARVAAPVVLQAIGAAPATGSGTGTATGTATGAPAAAGPPDLLASLLRAVLGALSASGTPLSATASVTVHGTPSAGEGRGAGGTANRFTGRRAHPGVARPLIFGIDDALLASLVGPVLQVLPELMNAANAGRLEMRQANNKLVTDLLAEVDRRRILEQLIAARSAQPAAPDLAALEAMLQEAASAAPSTAAATPQSLGDPVADKATPPAADAAVASRAVLSVLSAEPVLWDGRPTHLFVRTQDITVRVRLDVGEGGPRTPLPRAIATLVVKDPSDESVLLEKPVRLTDVVPGVEVLLPLTQAELAALPMHRELPLLVSLRWPVAGGARVLQAVAASTMTLVAGPWVVAQGGQVGGPHELVDMTQFRPFWNKVWESPTLEVAEGDPETTYPQLLWSLDATLRYTVALTAAPANGLMETRILRSPTRDSVTDATQGRMKGGLEVSVTELNKLLPLWPGEQPLGPALVEAFSGDRVVARHAGEIVQHVRLNGRRGERGMVWVVPVFTLHEFTVADVRAVDASGAVTAADERAVRFPLPESVRVIGLKSKG